MRPYQTFSAQDFACDEDFIKWVKHPDRYPFRDTFWRNWLLENPDKQDVIEEARHMILAVAHERQFLAEEGKQENVWARIEESIEVRRARQSFWSSAYVRAAVVVVAVTAGWFLVDRQTESESAAVVEFNSGPTFVTQVNNAATPKTIILSDGTSIIMQPHSVLEYPKSFAADKRQVFLKGQAFFEVVRDAERPFLVHAGEIVTRVLGTSFTVRNVEGEENVLVKVKTGKVSVFVAPGKSRPGRDNKSVEGVVLTPNQQVIFERQHMKMTKSLVENPAVLNPLAKAEFEFVDAPIKDVFGAIEEAYGVDIVFDEEALSSCFLNASLTDVPLYDKLKLICMGINTTYEIIDSHIIIYGSGCDEDNTQPQTQTI